MDADYSFYVKNIETHARAFLPLNISAIGTVYIPVGLMYLLWKDFSNLILYVSYFTSFLLNSHKALSIKNASFAFSMLYVKLVCIYYIRKYLY